MSTKPEGDDQVALGSLARVEERAETAATVSASFAFEVRNGPLYPPADRLEKLVAELARLRRQDDVLAPAVGGVALGLTHP